jgi:cytochrome P450
MHDPAIYSDPFSFRPERFLGPKSEPDPTIVFGFGRRACPGRVLAQASTYMFAAHLLAFFEVKPAYGPDGRELEAKVKYDGGGVV